MLYRYSQGLGYKASLQSKKSEDTWPQVGEEAKQDEMQRPVFQKESPSFLERVSSFGSNIFSRIFGSSEPDEASYSSSAVPVGVPQYLMDSQRAQSLRSSGGGSNPISLATLPSRSSSVSMSAPGGQHTSNSQGFDGVVAESLKLRISGLPLGVPQHVVNSAALFTLPSQKSGFFSSGFERNVAKPQHGKDEKRNYSSR